MTSRAFWQYKMAVWRPLAILKVSWEPEEGFRGFWYLKMTCKGFWQKNSLYKLNKVLEASVPFKSLLRS